MSQEQMHSVVNRARPCPIRPLLFRLLIVLPLIATALISLAQAEPERGLPNHLSRGVIDRSQAAPKVAPGWIAATIQMIEAGNSGNPPGLYGDVSDLDTSPSLYATASWACITTPSGHAALPVSVSTETRHWIQSKLLPGGRFASTGDQGLPFLYLVNLAVEAETCLGSVPSPVWIVDALQQVQLPSGLLSWQAGQQASISASLVGAEILHAARCMDKPVAHQLASALQHVVNAPGSFGATSVSALLNGDGIMALAGLDLLSSQRGSLHLDQAAMIRRALVRVRTTLATLPPSGSEVYWWPTLIEAANAINAQVAPSRAYLEILARAELPDGLFPLNPGQQLGDVQVTMYALGLLRQYGIRGVYEPALTRTEAVYRAATGGWHPIVAVTPTPSGTAQALAVLAALGRGSGNLPIERDDIAHWLNNQRIGISSPAGTLDEQVSWLADTFELVVAARYVGISQPELASVIGSIPIT